MTICAATDGSSSSWISVRVDWPPYRGLKMKVVITGGTGFIGLLLARRILEIGRLTGPAGQPEKIDELLLFDVNRPAEKPVWFDERVAVVSGEIADRNTVSRLIDRDDIAVFHLASVVSGGGEQDFDLAMRVNLEGNLHVLEALRHRASRPRIVFASSVAIYGGSAMPKTVSDTTKPVPQTTYGMTKAVGELLINDYTRKGFLDGRSARLPTVIIRPGKPNKAASSFASGVFREPLNGVECVLPVGLDTVMPVSGYRTIVEGFIRLHEASGEAIGEDRAVNFPSLSVSVGEMIDSLRRVAGPRPLGEIRVERDNFIEAIVAGWPTHTEAERARALGLPGDESLDSIVKAYIEDFLDRHGQAANS
ncbi:MAG: D-erythronate 2-dehydrogenase [Rhodospirillaceae bacterium]|nr:D-erythronate 2-dehydrogenase [Rhodospirillaceae bacterium]